MAVVRGIRLHVPSDRAASSGTNSPACWRMPSVRYSSLAMGRLK